MYVRFQFNHFKSSIDRYRCSTEVSITNSFVDIDFAYTGLLHIAVEIASIIISVQRKNHS